MISGRKITSRAESPEFELGNLNEQASDSERNKKWKKTPNIKAEMGVDFEIGGGKLIKWMKSKP